MLKAGVLFEKQHSASFLENVLRDCNGNLKTAIQTVGNSLLVVVVLT